MGFFDGGFGGIVSGIAGLAGGLMQNSYNSGQSEADRNFQREVMQNQYQWKAADARKAGLHPMAVIGSGSYSASPSSIPSADLSTSLGQLGQGIGDAFTAYKTKEQIAKEAAWQDEQKQMEREKHDMQIRIGASQVLENNSMALEATKRAESYSKAWATGREVIPGQVDAPSDKVKPMLQKFRKPDGSLTMWRPGSEYRELYEDVPLLEFRPHLDALYWDARDALSRVFSSRSRYGYSDGGRSYRGRVN